jgi:hypothetical protein
MGQRRDESATKAAAKELTCRWARHTTQRGARNREVRLNCGACT